ncbi:MAG TPA: hypothetical protein VIG99_10110 [Myxococcaceae bacterium]|jgi:hypothetical protein
MKRTSPSPLGTLALAALAALFTASGPANAEPIDQTTEVPSPAPPPSISSDQDTILPQSPPVLPSPTLPPGSDTAVPGTASSNVMDAGSNIGAGGSGTTGTTGAAGAEGLEQGGTGGAGTAYEPAPSDGGM